MMRWSELEKLVFENPYYVKGMDGKNCAINAMLNGSQISVPLVEGNKEYDMMMKQVKEGTLTIKEAE